MSVMHDEVNERFIIFYLFASLSFHIQTLAHEFIRNTCAVEYNPIQSSAAIDFTFMKLKNLQKADDVQFSLIKNSKIQINIKNKLSYLASH